MTMTTRYTVIDGEIIAEKRNGVRKQYVPDSQGSTVALLDNTQTPTDTFTYWPYGEVASRTGTTPTPFQFVGTLGCRQDSATKTYARARVLDTQKSRWLTEDPIGIMGGLNLYCYAGNQPTSKIDPQGTDYDWNPPFLDPNSPCGKKNDIANKTENCLKTYVPKHTDCNKRLGGQLLKIMRCIIGTENRAPKEVACDPWQPDDPTKPTKNQGIGPCRINITVHPGAKGTHPESDVCDNIRLGLQLICNGCFSKGIGLPVFIAQCKSTYNVLAEIPEKSRGNKNPFEECMAKSTYK